MPNIDEQGFDWDAMQQAEAPPEGPPPADDGEIQFEEPSPQLRDEFGRFVRSDEAPPPAPEAPQEDQPPEGDPSEQGYSPEVQALLTKYGGNVEAALAAAVEAQTFVGQRNQEVGELRREIQELREMHQRAVEQDEYDEFGEQFGEMIEEDAAEAAMAAFERGDNTRFQKAFDKWRVEDPVTARIWGEAMSARARAEALEANVQQQMQPLQQDRRQQAEVNVFAELAREHPDIEQHIDGINAVLRENQVLYFLAHEGIPEAKKQAIAMALQVAQARQTATQNGQVATQNRLAAQQEALAAEQAFVASGQNAVRQEGETLADVVTRGWDQISTSHHWG